jgi:hypothetical protein
MEAQETSVLSYLITYFCDEITKKTVKQWKIKNSLNTLCYRNFST